MNIQAWELIRQDQNSVPIRLEKNALLGSSGDSDILIMHPSVSPHHARLELNDKGVVIFDLDSKHGTFIDGDREEAVQLSGEEEGEYVVTFGKTEFIFRPVIQAMPPPLPGNTNPKVHIPIQVKTPDREPKLQKKTS